MKPALYLIAGILLLSGSALAGTPMEIGWAELLPPELRDRPLMPEPVHDLSALGEFDDELLGDPAVQLEPAAPVVAELDGRHIRRPGYRVPLGITEAMEVEEFLLVPWFGACIHVPPPPSNQIVHVRSTSGIPLDALYQPFWISGEVRVEQVESEMATAGYRIGAARVEPYLYCSAVVQRRQGIAFPLADQLSLLRAGAGLGPLEGTQQLLPLPVLQLEAGHTQPVGGPVAAVGPCRPGFPGPLAVLGQGPVLRQTLLMGSIPGQQLLCHQLLQQTCSLPGRPGIDLQRHQVVQIPSTQPDSGLMGQTQGSRSGALLPRLTLQGGQLPPVFGPGRVALEQHLLPLGSAAMVALLVTHAHQQLIPDVIGGGIGAHHLLGQRDGPTILPQPAVALHQQLGLLQVQASLPALLLQQPGGLGKLLLGGQQLGQIEPVLARRLRLQSIMGQGLAQPADGCLVLPGTDGHIAETLLNQCQLQTPGRGLLQRGVEQAAGLGQITLLLCLLGAVQRSEDHRTDRLLSHTQCRCQQQSEPQQDVATMSDSGHGYLPSRRKYRVLVASRATG